MVTENEIDLVILAINRELYYEMKKQGWRIFDSDYAVAEDTTAPSELMRVRIQLDNEKDDNLIKTVHVDLRNVLERDGKISPLGVLEEVKRAFREAGIIL